jgi:hypothetical protein
VAASYNGLGNVSKPSTLNHCIAHTHISMHVRIDVL